VLVQTSIQHGQTWLALLSMHLLTLVSVTINYWLKLMRVIAGSTRIKTMVNYVVKL